MSEGVTSCFIGAGLLVFLFFGLVFLWILIEAIKSIKEEMKRKDKDKKEDRWCVT